MKLSSTKALLTVLSLTVFAATGCRADADAAAVKDAAVAGGTAQAAAPVWHVVAFRFKTDAQSRAQIPGVVEAFSRLQTLSVDPADPSRRLITSFHAGVNNSTEQVSFGAKGVPADRSTEYTFVLTFANAADRDYYVDHEPAHQSFKALVGPLLENGTEGVFVSDFKE